MTIRITTPGRRKGLSRPARKLTPEQRETRRQTFERFKFGKDLKPTGNADAAEMRRLADDAVAEGKVTKLKPGYAGHAAGMQWEELWAGRTPK